MPLSSLILNGAAKVQDLTPLTGMPLTYLDIIGCVQVRDVTPLDGMNLQTIALMPKNITQGMDILRQMKSLKTVHDGVKAIPVAEFWKRYDAGEYKK